MLKFNIEKFIPYTMKQLSTPVKYVITVGEKPVVLIKVFENNENLDLTEVEFTFTKLTVKFARPGVFTDFE